MPAPDASGIELRASALRRHQSVQSSIVKRPAPLGRTGPGLVRILGIEHLRFPRPRSDEDVERVQLGARSGRSMFEKSTLDAAQPGANKAPTGTMTAIIARTVFMLIPPFSESENGLSTRHMRSRIETALKKRQQKNGSSAKIEFSLRRVGRARPVTDSWSRPECAMPCRRRWRSRRRTCRSRSSARPDPASRQCPESS